MDTFIDWTKNKNAKLKCYFISNKRVNQVLSQQSLWALSVDLAHTVILLHKHDLLPILTQQYPHVV